MPEFPNRIPVPLTEMLARAKLPEDPQFDFSIEGIPFMIKDTDQTPYIRETADIRKDQIDQSPEAGEQTLSFWWLRSQASFHGGAGLKYLDGGKVDDITRVRFHASRGVDVWTPGSVTRLPSTKQAVDYGTGPVQTVSVVVAGNVRIVYSAGATLAWVEAGAAGTYDYGGTQDILSLATDGTNVYVGASDGVYLVDAASAAAGIKQWTVTAATRMTLGWVKERLMAAIDATIYELAPLTTATPWDLPSPVYTHPNGAWTWTGFANGPTAILASGYAGSHSAVMQLTLTETGDTPVLAGAQTAATLPEGELCFCMYGYMGSLLGIGTSKGVRVSPFDPFYGNLQLGPLTLETTADVRCLTGFNRFLYFGLTAGVDGVSGLGRVDLGTKLDQAGHYAYATDLTPTTDLTGDVTSASMDVDGGVWFAVDGDGIWTVDSASEAAEAWLETARIRFSTVEPKLYKYGLMKGDFSNGSISVWTQTPGQPFSKRFTLTNFLGDPDEFKLVEGPVEWLALKFVFGLPETTDSTFELRSYQVKGLPASVRQRIIQVPVLCFDFETDSSGRRQGREGWAMERLGALEALENAGDEVTIVSRLLGPHTTERGVIERVSFRDPFSPPRLSTAFKRGGGYLTLQIRTVSA